MTQLLGVALPVRNGADYLAEALESILAQGYSDFEVHVSDNASTDATPDILADFAARDRRIRPSRSAEPLGQVANTNRAAALASSQWIKLFCHDDLMRPDCLARTVEAIQAGQGTRTALVGNLDSALLGDGTLYRPPADGSLVWHDGREALRTRLAGKPGVFFPAVSTAAVRKDAFFEMGGFDDRWLHFDIFGWMELLMRYDMVQLNDDVTTTRIHSNQVNVHAHTSMRTIEDYRGFYPEFLANHADALGLDAKGRARAKLIPVSTAAKAVAFDIRVKRFRRAAGTLRRLPLAWLPLIPFGVLRAYRQESRRFASFGGKVPADLIYF